MKLETKLAVILAAVAFLLPAISRADSIDDPLHGYCGGAGQCIDNGTNSPTTTSPPSNFGFTVSPGPASGDLVVDILTPNDDAAGPSFTITGTLSGTASLFSATAWTSGQLDAYLGISASPANPIGAYLPSTQDLDAGATGFFVYQVNLGAITLEGANDPNDTPLENIASGTLPLGSYIVGFLNEAAVGATPDWIATANSGAIFESNNTTVPEPSSLLLMGMGLVAVAFMYRRKQPLTD